MKCIACKGDIPEEADSAFYCSDFCEDIGLQAWYYHFVEIPIGDKD